MMNNSGENIDLYHWLSDNFSQHAMPLKLQYITLLYQHMTLLNLYLHSPNLTKAQHCEILSWINQLSRIAQSYSLIYASCTDNVDDMLTSEKLCNSSLWCLFGAATQEEITHNIEDFCRNIKLQISQTRAIINDITSSASLAKYLQQRQTKDIRAALFLDDPNGNLIYT